MNDCTKIPYPTPAAAKFAATRIGARYLEHGADRIPRGVHPCPQCHAWHITSHRTKAKFRVVSP